MAIPFEQLEGKYEILEKMSEGGMGAVYRVRHRLLDEIRVIKVMRPQLADDPLLRARFLREAKIAVKLRHPNLAQIYDYAVDDKGYSYIVMEFIDGVNLQELLKTSGPPALGLLLEIAHQALGVIDYIHRKEVVHRDISPDNLLLAREDDGSPVVKMIDLGIAKAQATESGLTTEGAFLGKVRYSSPEHFRSREGVQVGPHSDIYSFGVVLYELATGTYPIRGSSLSSFIAGHLLHPPLDFARTDPDGHIPQQLREAILTALAKDPGERFPSAGDFDGALADLRRANPLERDSLRAVFEVEGLETRRMEVIKPGSTQDRLDDNFGLSSTPPPPSATPPPLPTTPASSSSPGQARAGSAQLDALLVGAEKLLEAHHYGAAVVQARAALEIDPTSQEGQRLLRAAGEAEEKRRARRQAAARAVIEAIEAGDLDGAGQELAVAAERLGECPELDEARTRLEAEREQLRQQADEIQGLLAQATAELRKGRVRDAVQTLQRAVSLDPEHAEARRRLNQAVAEQERIDDARRREQRVAQLSVKITRFLASGALEEAEEALQGAEEEFPDAEAFRGLRTRMEQLRSKLKKQEAESLCESAQRALDAGDPPTAIAQLEVALRYVPDLGRARQMLQVAQDEASRLERVRKALDGVERLLRAGRHDSALQSLDAAVGELGDFDGADDMRRRLEAETARRRQRRQQLDDMLARARSQARKARVDESSRTLQEARRQFGDDQELLDLVEAAQADVVRLAEEARRARALEEAGDSIRRRLDEGTLDDARRELDVATRLFGDDPTLRPLRERLEQLEGDERRSRAGEMLREALESETSFPKMIDKLEKALAIDPGNATVQRVLAETRAAQTRYQQERRSKAIAQHMATIDGLIAAGRRQEAIATLDRAVAEFGEFPEARSVRRRLEGPDAG